MKKLSALLALGILQAIAFLCRITPRFLHPFIGRVLGDIVYFLSVYRKALARANLSFILGEDKRKLARKVFQNLGMNLVEFLTLPHFKDGTLKELCLLKGKEYLIQALKEGRGAILLTAHFGNWELIGARLALEGFRIISPARPQEEFEKHIERIRKCKGYRTLSVDKGLVPLLCFLKKGGVVCILSDQNILFGGVNVPFFGIPVSTPPGAAILALRSGAPVLPVFSLRVGRYHIIQIQPPLSLTRNRNFREDVLKNTTLFNKVIEEWIRKYPEQWLWLHHRWRRTR